MSVVTILRLFRPASVSRNLAAVNSASILHKKYVNRQIKTDLYSSYFRGFSASPRLGQQTLSRNPPRPIGSAVRIASSTLTKDGQFVNVQWDNSVEATYPYCWIRDNCPCSDCFHINENISERLIPISQQNIDNRASEIHVDEDGQFIRVTGTDGHPSTLEASWLFDRQLCKKDSCASDVVKPILWDTADIQKVYPTFQYNDIISDNDGLRAWLDALKRYGVALLQNSPTQENELLNLGKRVSFLREAMWGLISSIKAKPDSYVLAYSSGTILLHADMAYMTLQPGVLLLHCLSNPAGTGGENMLVDGFNAARILKETDAEAYRILTTVKVEHGITGIEHGSYFHYHLSKPTISLDDDGNPVCISYHEHLRTSKVSASTVEEVAEFYRALKKFSDILYDPVNMYKRRLLEGEILAVSNIRLLHGRESFTFTEDKARHIESAYLDWNEIDSRLRVLKKGLI
ncbi:gamma-butyrobetaine dioxygenase-like [Anneissia japonica]|uniref:gamma-butyrobetaine dioxygenase-like n=1 Tax=Anneissia japonica TaxID=1529436 RepID=UPI001425B5DB|nr:gamma-butyrobetaine dioxygenase-like [Anneissia japonica]XP_033100224.1 gamma-butyrobetaine dioxygenase-like [Anneissia japonica]